MRVAVVGHVEWIEFGRVDHVPAAGEIVHVSELWEEPGGGGAVAAVQLAKLAGGGDAVHGARRRRARPPREASSWSGSGCAWRRPSGPSRSGARSSTWTPPGERTITVIGSRLGPGGRATRCPGASSPETDAVYFTAGDVEAVRAARAARCSCRPPAGSTRCARRACSWTRWSRARGTRASATSPGELDPPPRYVVRTAGRDGGEYETADGRRGSLEGDAPARTDQRPLRLRRQLRRRPHLRARRRHADRRRRSTSAPAAAPPAPPDAAPSPVSCATA